MDVISSEEGRIIINDKFVSKKTKIGEVNNLFIARKMIDGIDLNINGKKYEICLPEVYDYNNGILKMERCRGDNLEILLRNRESHTSNASNLNNILLTLLDNRFFWNDFAPRNIMLNDSEKKVFLFDFERGVSDKNTLSNYFLYPVLEEYSAFLLRNERLFNENILLNTDLNQTIDISQIKSNRIINIMKKMGYSDIKKIDYIKIVIMIIRVEEPFIFNNNFIFPIIELENILHRYGYDTYANEVIKRYEKCKNI